MEEDQIIGVWDTFKDYIPEKNRETAANHFVDFLVGLDVELSVLKSVMGYDPHLDDAIQLIINENSDEDPDVDEDDIDYYEDED
jgi:hypothetical protein